MQLWAFVDACQYQCVGLPCRIRRRPLQFYPPETSFKETSLHRQQLLEWNVDKATRQRHRAISSYQMNELTARVSKCF